MLKKIINLELFKIIKINQNHNNNINSFSSFLLYTIRVLINNSNSILENILSLNMLRLILNALLLIAFIEFDLTNSQGTTILNFTF